jgi:hypothetical protein
VEQIAAWRSGLDARHARIAPRRARPEVRARARRFLAARLGRVERTNGGPLASPSASATPHGVPRLLKAAPGTPPRALGAPSEEQAVLRRWSGWRRRGQAAARRSHDKRHRRRTLRLSC